MPAVQFDRPGMLAGAPLVAVRMVSAATAGGEGMVTAMPAMRAVAAKIPRNGLRFVIERHLSS
ncbi:hypothetical protein GCM10025789_21170 [Tessaracoccus lubricantis]|uniref:Uncharacterized protein n=1 Tax=Tessaracoccus lubricantis TaxID=545543 RepID=A0ABP9FG68_9ACTN